MVYCRLKQSYNSKFWVTEGPGLDERFLSGKLITTSIPEPVVFGVSGPADASPGHFLGDTIPVVSKQFIEILTGLGIDNFQTFSAVLRDKESGKEWSDYFAFNVVGLLDTADMRSSSADVIMGGGATPELVDFETLVIDLSKTRGQLMYREMRSPDLLIVDAKVRDSLVGNKPPSGWGVMLDELPST